MRPKVSVSPSLCIIPQLFPITNIEPTKAQTDIPPQNSKHQNNHKRTKTCEICRKGYAEQKDLSRHYVVHHPDSPQAMADKDKPTKVKVPCPDCNQMFRSDNMKRHRDTVHLKMKGKGKK